MVLKFARDWGRAKTVCLRAKAILDKRVVNDVKLPHSRAPGGAARRLVLQQQNRKEESRRKLVLWLNMDMNGCSDVEDAGQWP